MKIENFEKKKEKIIKTENFEKKNN